MSAKRIIAVLGSTGNQGGSVAKIFLNDPKLKRDWTVRAITRDITKESAKKLEGQGAELVAVSCEEGISCLQSKQVWMTSFTNREQANINDGGSLAKAFSGAAAVFAVTNYWDTMSKEGEEQQGKTIVDAAKVSPSCA